VAQHVSKNPVSIYLLTKYVKCGQWMLEVLWCYIGERWRLRVNDLYLFMLVIRFVR